MAAQTQDDAAAHCPECGSSFTIDTDAEIGERYFPKYHLRGQELPVRLRRATVAFCTGCEFCIELKP